MKYWGALVNTNLFKDLTLRSEKALTVLRFYYFILCGLYNSMALPRALSSSVVIDPLFQVAWVPYLPAGYGEFLICFGGLVISMAAAVFPASQILRALAFLFLFFWDGLRNSSGSPSHLLQFWLWTSFVLSLMPALKTQNSRASRMVLLNYLYATILMLALMYSLSGLWKTLGVFQQMLRGEDHFLSLNGLLYHIASEKIRAGATPILEPLLYAAPFVGPLLSFFVIVLQLGALVFAFRFKYHRWLGIAVLMFHLGTYFFLSITYPTNFVLVGVLFLCSPLVDVQTTYKSLLVRLKTRLFY